MTRSMRRCTACRSGSPGLGTSCGMSAGLPGSPSPLPSAAALLGQCGLVLLLRHADRADPAPVHELGDHRVVAGEQHLARAEHDQVAAEQHADVVRHGPGDHDVVRHDQDGGVDLRVQVDQQLGQVGGAHRVEAGVRLVAQDDLRVEHQGPGQPGALAHAAGDLTGELVLLPGQADHLHLGQHDLPDLGLGLLRVLAQREGDVVVQVQRAEQRAVLEHHAEQLAHLVELALRAVHRVGAVDHHPAAVRPDQADQRLQEHRLAGAGGTEHDAHLAGRQGERDITPHDMAPEGLGQPFHDHLGAHLTSLGNGGGERCGHG